MNVLIVEDHQMFREILHKACEREYGCRVVGATASGEEAIRLAKQHRPDVVLLDLSLPEMDGFAIAETLRREMPGLKILILSSHCDNQTIARVEQLAVQGYVDKNFNSLGVVGEALKVIAAGRAYFSQTYTEARLAMRADPVEPKKVLSPHETTILSLLGLGLSDEEVAQRVGLSKATVQGHRSQIMRKLGIQGTPKLIRYAIEKGFTEVPASRRAGPALP